MRMALSSPFAPLCSGIVDERGFCGAVLEKRFRRNGTAMNAVKLAEQGLLGLGSNIWILSTAMISCRRGETWRWEQRGEPSGSWPS